MSTTSMQLKHLWKAVPCTRLEDGGISFGQICILIGNGVRPPCVFELQCILETNSNSSLKARGDKHGVRMATSMQLEF